MGDPVVTFNLFEDVQDTNVTALIAATLDGSLQHLAWSLGDITQSAVTYWELESMLIAPNTADRGEPSIYEVEARKHADAENTPGLLRKVTT